MNPALLALLGARVAAASLGLPVTDSFDRADAGTLGVADTGHTWTNRRGAFGIVSNQAAPSVSGGSMATVGVTVAAVTVSAAITKGDGDYCRLVARVVDVDNFYMVQLDINTLRKVWIIRRQGGVETVVVASGMDALLAPADTTVHNISLSVQEEGGSTRLIVKVDGIQKATYLDSTAGRPATGDVGIYGSSTGTRFNDFSATAL